MTLANAPATTVEALVSGPFVITGKAGMGSDFFVNFDGACPSATNWSDNTFREHNLWLTDDPREIVVPAGAVLCVRKLGGVEQSNTTNISGSAPYE